MRLFVTGATGFAGGHLVEMLLAAGHTVTALVHAATSRHELAVGVTAVAGDLLDEMAVLTAVAEAQPDIIYHLAGQAYPARSWQMPGQTIAVNTVGTANVLHERTLSLAVVRSKSVPVGGEFGWSLPQGDKPLPFGDIASLLSHSGASWVKFPLWYDASNKARGARNASATRAAKGKRLRGRNRRSGLKPEIFLAASAASARATQSAGSAEWVP